MIQLSVTTSSHRQIVLWLVADAEKREERRVRSRLMLELSAEGQLLACQLMNVWAEAPLTLRRASALLDPELPPEGHDPLLPVGAHLRVLPHSESLMLHVRAHHAGDVQQRVKVSGAELILDREDRLVGLAIPQQPEFNPALGLLGLGSMMA